MKKSLYLFVFLIYCIQVPAETPNEVKFYNLEKEYQKTVTFVYKVKHAQTLELKQIVSDMLSIYGSLYVNEKTNELYITDVEEKIDDLKAVIPGLDVDKLRAGNNLVSKKVYLKHENSSEIINIVKHKLSPDGSTYEVPTLNALVITDIPSKINEVVDLLNLIDVPVKHIAIEIIIVEFNNEEFSRLGFNVFNWLQGLSIQADLHGKRKGDIFYITHGNFTAQAPTDRTLKPRDPSLEEQEKQMPYHFSARLRVSDIVGFICEHADGSVLASTRIVTKNNKTAYIYARETIPFRFSENEVALQSSYENRTITGTTVRVCPTVQQDSLINLQISPVISDLTGWSPKGMPIVFERSINTEVKVKDNTVFVLGGLKKRESVVVRKGIPGLKEIPVLKYLFSIKQKVIVEREVLIFIRPTTQVETPIDSEDFKSIMEKYKKVVDKERGSRKRRRKE